ncbi:MAG TPA: TetR/AcrR family transcriptional regulator [Sphingobacteriaceae bacterium]
MDNQDKKRELILEAALKRFAHFGLSKTTMAEIAQDLSFSKALLYYYFPDKIRLYAAVMQSLIETMGAVIRQEVAGSKTALDAMLIYLQKRQEFVKTHYNLLSESDKTPEMPQSVLEIFQNAVDAEKVLIAEIFAKAEQNGEIRPVKDREMLADIFQNAVTGIRLHVRMPHKFMLPDKGQFDLILGKEKMLASIFFKGLQ